MIAERLIAPGSKLATTRLRKTTTLAEELSVGDADVDELYNSLDWLLERQDRIEKKLAKKHLSPGSLVLYDVSSSYYEGHTWEDPPMTRMISQFRVELLKAPYPIWREILIAAEYSFWDLHVALQDALGWTDSHLHAFEIARADMRPIEIGIPTDDLMIDQEPVLEGWNEQLTHYFVDPGEHARYRYDFGDDWTHALVFQGASPRPSGLRLPKCLAGAGRCPPEDVGGMSGFEEFLTVMKTRSHPESAEMIAWYGGVFEPTGFSPKHVKFDNPKKRLRIAFG